MITDNFKIDELQLMSGAPITVPGLELKIHQPKLFEIASIGETSFYNYLSFFKISKEIVLSTVENEQHKMELSFKTDYEILKILMDDQPDIQDGIREIFKLLIKDAEIIKFNESFIFIRVGEGQQYVINDDSFSLIKEIIYKIFNINPKETSKKEEFNPSNDIAAQIVEKLKQRKEALEKEKASSKKDSSQGKKDQSVLADFVSILAVGLSMSVRDVLNLTIYQIFNLMTRFGMYNQYQLQVQAMLQGAENVELVDWFQKI